MTTSTLPETIIGVGGLLFFAVMLWRFFSAFRETAHALGDVAEGAVIALATHRERKLREEERFYRHPRTPDEVNAALEESRRQLAVRSGLHADRVLSFLPPETTSVPLELAVVTRFVPSTAELHRRITFLEAKLREGQSGFPLHGMFSHN